jgi:diguanylate cyclase
MPFRVYALAAGSETRQLMFVIPAAIGTFLFVNVICAAVALTVGFAAGVWFFGMRRAALEKSAKPQPTPNKEAERQTERAAMASGRLVDLAKSMATDVSDHAAKVNEIAADFRSADRTTAGAADAAINSALDRILAANADLQRRLEVAEKQIEVQAEEIRSHETEARTDSLTGLSNRRAFDDEMRRRVSEFERKKIPFTLVMLDIDHFKKFNDTHGHQVGDEVLRTVARVLKQQSRDMDLPCRYGGEEFAVILPSTEIDGACIVAERIREAIEASVTACDGKTLKVTSSLGLAEVLINDNPTRVIKRADEALYKSKEAGRNCGHWNDGDTCYPLTELPTDHAPPEAKSIAVKPQPAPENRQINRTTFIHVLKRRVAESHRFGIPLSVMHLKIEEYDSICRLYGNAIGRHALDAASTALERALREADMLAPLDGGEFLLMLPNYTLGEVGQLARRLKLQLAHCTVPEIDREMHLHFRHSIAELKPGETAQELLARARSGAPGRSTGEAPVCA